MRAPHLKKNKRSKIGEGDIIMRKSREQLVKESSMVMQYVNFYRALGFSHKEIAECLYNDGLICYWERDVIASWED